MRVGQAAFFGLNPSRESYFKIHDVFGYGNTRYILQILEVVSVHANQTKFFSKPTMKTPDQLKKVSSELAWSKVCFDVAPESFEQT